MQYAGPAGAASTVQPRSKSARTRAPSSSWRAVSAARSVVARSRWARTGPSSSPSRCSRSWIGDPVLAGQPGELVGADPVDPRQSGQGLPERALRRMPRRRGCRGRPGRRRSCARPARSAGGGRLGGAVADEAEDEPARATRARRTRARGARRPGPRGARRARRRRPGRRRAGRGGSATGPSPSRCTRRKSSPSGGTRVANSSCSPRGGDRS